MINRYASLRQGLVGCWVPSLGASGFRLIDRSGYNNHGVLTGMDPGTDWVPSGGKLALDFDGVNDYATIPSSPYLDSVSQFFISAWMKRNSSGISVVQKAQNNENRITLSLFSDGNLYFVVANGFVAYGSFAFASTAWTHVAAVYNGNLTGNNKAIVFLNGMQLSLSYTNAIPATTANLSAQSLEFGAERWAGVYGNGQLDDVRIYNRALTPNEIRLLAQSRMPERATPQRTRTVFYSSGLVSYLRRRTYNSILGSGVLS